MANTKPFPLASVRRGIIRLPARDWPALVAGAKTEVRLSGVYAPFVRAAHPPEPFIGYAVRYENSYRAPGVFPELLSHLFVNEAMWAEPLGAITDESLEREGFEPTKEGRRAFRRRWREGHPRTGYKPLTKVVALRLHPLREEEWSDHAERMMWRLYAEENWREGR